MEQTNFKMATKRRWAAGASASRRYELPLGEHAPTTDKKGSALHPLGTGPAFDTLTPRSIEKSRAELEALRSRVQQLESKLSQNEVNVLLAQTHATKKLPPLASDALASDQEVRLKSINVGKTHGPETDRWGFP